MKNVATGALIVVVGFGTVASLSTDARAADLKPETVEAWRNYVQSAGARLEASTHSGSGFLKAAASSDVCARLQRGEVVVAPGSDPTPRKVPSGLIHDWIASAFFPGVRVDDVLDTFRRYDDYKQFYKPTVLDSRQLTGREMTAPGLAGDEGGDGFSLILRNRSIMSHTALQSDYRATYTQLDPTRWYSVAYSTRIREIENYGEPNQRRLDAGEGTGYIWRMETIAKFEQRDGGVYVELEAIALSRDIPGSLRWVVDPMIRRISKRSLTAYMTSTRDAVMSSVELSAIRSTSAQSR